MSTQMLDAYLSLSNIGREMSADSGDLHEVYFLFQIISVQIPVFVLLCSVSTLH